jgi:hypothetical protein
MHSAIAVFAGDDAMTIARRQLPLNAQEFAAFIAGITEVGQGRADRQHRAAIAEALDLDIDISPTLLARADEVIE